MILAKAPLRVSFFGGGSDIPKHFNKWGGSTISTAIDKYVYVAVMHYIAQTIRSRHTTKDPEALIY